jgi:ferric-dicitrate binding protein FerR (iron transport regulator)
MTPEVRRELQGLLSALCDGQLTEAQQSRLEQLLVADAECRRHYLEYVDLHARLLVHPRFRAEEASPPSNPAPSTEAPSPEHIPPLSRGRRPAPQVLRYVLVAGATLAASLLLQVIWWHPQPPEGKGSAGPAPRVVEPKPPGYVATLTQAADCVWDNPKEPWQVGSRLPPGEVRLRQGIARIRFDSGPDLVVEGPAGLRLESSTAATVLRGKVVFRADETSAPFDLHTPSSTLVDFGTEYAVAVGPDGEEVHVFDGEVQRTPRTGSAKADPEHLRAGQARRYGPSPGSPGRPTALDRETFVQRLAALAKLPPDPAAGLLAYEGFDYADAAVLPAGKANGGTGWAGPWTPGFARPLNKDDTNRLALNVKESLVRPGSAQPSVGGCFDYTGFTKYWRRLATPVRLDTDGVYYLSFLFRRHGPPADPLNAVAVLLRTDDEFRRNKEDPRTRLNIGVGGTNELFTHLQKVGSRTPLPLSYGETYLLVAKVVASRSNADQVFMRVYGPQEPVERLEPGSWSVVGPPLHSDLVFDWLEVHINSKTRQTIDEIRLGTTWSSVTAPWVVAAAPGKGGKP